MCKLPLENYLLNRRLLFKRLLMQLQPGRDRFALAASSLILASALWAVIFLVKPLDFWVMMSLSTIALLFVAVVVNRDRVSLPSTIFPIMLGLVSGLLLYGLFLLGFQATKNMSVIGQGVSEVYAFRSTSSLVIGLLILFPIAPSEEVYWRGLIQRRFAERLGPLAGFLSSSAAYSLVHLPTLNPSLILTALIGGLVWGYLYLRTKSLVPGIVSHVLFDLLIFVVAPLA